MQKESIIECFKELLAEAMMLGSLSADINYRGTIEATESKAMRESMKKLSVKIQQFIATARLEDINVPDVLPLQDEIEALTNN